MRRPVLMLTVTALMELLILLAAVMTVVVVTTAATAGPAFARPVIGGEVPGSGRRDPHADTNPANDNRTQPNTGGQSHHFF